VLCNLGSFFILSFGTRDKALEDGTKGNPWQQSMLVLICRRRRHRRNLRPTCRSPRSGPGSAWLAFASRIGGVGTFSSPAGTPMAKMTTETPRLLARLILSESCAALRRGRGGHRRVARRRRRRRGCGLGISRHCILLWVKGGLVTAGRASVKYLERAKNERRAAGMKRPPKGTNMHQDAGFERNSPQPSMGECERPKKRHAGFRESATFNGVLI